MPDTVVVTNQPGLSALVALVATADLDGQVLLSSNRLVDALLDARGEVGPAVVPLVDEALAASAHRHVVPTEEALALVTAITGAESVATPAG